MIKYNDFVNDLLANVSFVPSEMIGENYKDLDNCTCALTIPGDLHGKVYSLDPGQTSDYFYYKNQKYCIVGDQLRCYSENPYILSVMGAGDFSNVRERITTEVALFFNELALIDSTRNQFKQIPLKFDESGGFDDLMRFVTDTIKAWAKKAVSHMLLCDYDFNIGLPRSNFYDFKNMNGLSVDGFFEYINWDELENNLFGNFNTDKINLSHNRRVAENVLMAVCQHKKVNSGVKIQSHWYKSWSDNNWWNSNRMIQSMIELLKLSGKREWFLSLLKIKSNDLSPGDNLVLGEGMKIWMYKEHYTLQLPSDVFNCVLVFLNKYIPEKFEAELQRAA